MVNGGGGEHNLCQLDSQIMKPVVLIEEETGPDSARIKQMVSDFKKDVAFYKKMSEVYRLAAVAFKENMMAELQRQSEEAQGQKEE